ncbi:MAG: hypothetical protein CL398_10555 [Acidiferrobacteraceae bacterium]|nr:hypothetical protein [Acidiferrobacteraceae bacterium]|tara:strand:+ start:227 stop:652 length:426 start_codon:yes stop_codon:yes gene_type:complete
MSNQLSREGDLIPQIGSPSHSRLFSLDEAISLLPLVKKVTAIAITGLEPTQLRYLNLLDCDPRKRELESEYEKLVRLWMEKMARLGLLVPGLWEVNFDTGEGYLSWKYPELELAFFVEYGDPNLTRHSLTEVLYERGPCWA